MTEDLTRTVRRLADKDEIVDLVHRYSYLVDHRMHDELAELFTEDCVVDYGPGVGPVVNGRVAFRRLLGPSGPLAEGRQGFVVTSHHNANVLIEFDGDDRALVRTSIYAWHRTPDEQTPQMWGYYHDVAVRTAGGWRLAERQLRVAGNAGWDVEWIPLTGRS